jgi:DNA-binding response OmpR family regulator
MSATSRILVVDDEPGIRSMLSEHLSAIGYAVTAAGDAQAALSSVQTERPDLVLLDIGLPGMNGLEVLRRIRRHDWTIGVIVFTGNQDVALARSTIQLGAIDCIFKPLDLDRLDRAVTAGIGRVTFFD